MNVSLPSMLKLLQHIVDINNAGVTGRIYRSILTLSMRAFGPRNSAYAFWTTTDTHTYRHISREISIEHPSVGLASLAQLISTMVYAIAALAWTEEKRSLRNEKLKAKRAT